MPANNSVIFAASRSGECEWVRETLSEYLGHGDDAPVRMPRVHDHLKTCDWCREEFESLQAVASRLKPEWQALIKTLANRAPVPASESRSVIEWLTPRWNAERLVTHRLASGAHGEEFTSEIDLSGTLGIWGMRVSPLPPQGWEIAIEQRAAGAERLVVGLGDSSGPIFGTRVLKYGHPAVFLVPARELSELCLHFDNRRVKFPEPEKR